MTITGPATAATDADRAAIAAVPARMVEIWAKHDADGFAELFTQDGTLILPGVYRKGRDEIRAFMAAQFADAYRGTRVTGQPVEVIPLAPGAVALTTVGGVLAPGESELSAEAAIRASWILVKRGDAWLLAVYHNCPRDPAP
ncbi:SgcJ/EcaC family oxidoreductase [Plantactinospora veratri]|uniref:SgcJ/EcaC family oxidoreductase n=1 Tax=Plantactinospora veratri TaxID=1436122 RepID=A0ABU7SB77_9ACTN